MAAAALLPVSVSDIERESEMPELLFARAERVCINSGRVERGRLEGLGQSVGHGDGRRAERRCGCG